MIVGTICIFVYRPGSNEPVLAGCEDDFLGFSLDLSLLEYINMGIRFDLVISSRK